MSLDVMLKVIAPCEIYSRNITHNLGAMAKAADVYMALWRPDEIGITKARDLIVPLAKGLETLKSDPDTFMALNPPNGWGSYDALVDFIAHYLNACIENPDAIVEVSR